MSLSDFCSIFRSDADPDKHNGWRVFADLLSTTTGKEIQRREKRRNREGEEKKKRSEEKKNEKKKTRRKERKKRFLSLLSSSSLILSLFLSPYRPLLQLPTMPMLYPGLMYNPNDPAMQSLNSVGGQPQTHANSQQTQQGKRVLRREEKEGGKGREEGKREEERGKREEKENEKNKRRKSKKENEKKKERDREEREHKDTASPLTSVFL